MKKLFRKLALIAIVSVMVLIPAISAADGLKIGGVFYVECYAPDGTLKWTETAHNIITNEGLDHILDVVLHGTSATATWYVGLKNTGAVAAADTMSSHSGWTENENYNEAARQEYVEAAASSQSTTNSASTADFTISTNLQTIAGAFLTSVSTKGGTTGVLLAAADFSAAQAVDAGDTLRVTYTITASDN